MSKKIKFTFAFFLIVIVLLLLTCVEDNKESASFNPYGGAKGETVKITGKISLPSGISDVLPDYDEDFGEILPDFDEDIDKILPDYDEEIGNFSGKEKNLQEIAFSLKKQTLVASAATLAGKSVVLFVYDKMGNPYKFLKQAKLNGDGTYEFSLPKNFYDVLLLGVGLGNRDKLLAETIVWKTQQNQLSLNSDLVVKIMSRIIIPYKKDSFGNFENSNRNKLLEIHNSISSITEENKAEVRASTIEAYEFAQVNNIASGQKSGTFFNLILNNTRLENENQIRFLISEKTLWNKKSIDLKNIPAVSNTPEPSKTEKPDSAECISKSNPCDQLALDKNTKLDFINDNKKIVSFIPEDFYDSSDNHLKTTGNQGILTAVKNKTFLAIISSGNLGYSFVELIANGNDWRTDVINDKNGNFPADYSPKFSNNKGWYFPYRLFFSTSGYKCLAFVSNTKATKEDPLTYVLYKSIYVKETEMSSVPDCPDIPQRPVYSQLNGQKSEF